MALIKGYSADAQAENTRSLKAKGLSERDAVLVSMKRAKKDKDKSMECCSVGPENDYPYGLCISLEDESLDKLSIDKLPTVGKKVKLTAEATVDRVSENASKDSKSRSVSLQITKMKLG